MKLLKFFSFGFLFLSFGAAFAEPVEVAFKLSPVGSFFAKSSSIDGEVVLEGGKVKASNVRVPVKSLKTTMELRDKHLAERLESEKFPEIILVSGEGDSGKGKGIIKIKGIEKPIDGTYTVEGNIVKANFKLSLKDFNIEKLRYLNLGVKDEVDVKVQMPLTAKATVAPATKAEAVPAAKTSEAPATKATDVTPVKPAVPANKKSEKSKK